MHSSTSNSDIRRKRWETVLKGTTSLVIVFVLFFAIMTSWELFWRFRGFSPTIGDDWTIWSQIRREANRSPDSIALVGASRIMLGLDPQILAGRLSRPVHMLAIDGSNPLPVFRNLAEDTHFRGNVIISFTPFWLANAGTTDRDKTAKWLRKYKKQTFSSKIETTISTWLDARLVFRQSSLSPEKLWEKWRAGKPIRPPYAPLRQDRFRMADYTKTDLTRLRLTTEKRIRELHAEMRLLGEEPFLQRVQTMQNYIETIEKRGGKVVFLRIPSCGAIREIEKQFTPRESYWNVLVENISAPVFHFEDYSAMQRYQCTDGSHMQFDDAIRLTNDFVDLALENNIFPNPARKSQSQK